MKPRRPRLTYANVVASLALFIALGGASYAATSLPKGSVGTDQIQAEAVRTGKVADDAVTAAKLAQGVRERLAPVGGVPATTTITSTPESVKHADTAHRALTAVSAESATLADRAKIAASAETATSAKSADSATTAESAATAKSADTAENAKELGGQPASHYLTAGSVLQPGQTEAGDYIAAAGNGEAGTVLVQFWPHLPESVHEGHIKVLAEGAPGTTECPGPGQAAPTYMCVYQSFNEGMSFESFISTMPGSTYAGPVSGVMTWRSNQFNGLLRGTWAYTAP
ncbi:MAG: hypothetical protein JST59_05815 [Actinobacteria bacterium]|nr:hypothetical protein [Actinomycetota bacterium]